MRSQYLAYLASATLVRAASLPQQQHLLTADRELVNTNALQADITEDALMKRARALYDIAKLGEDEYGHPTRVIGSEGHTGTIDYIYEQLDSLGSYYSITNQTFPAVAGHIFESRLLINNTLPASAAPFALTPPTANHDVVSGSLIAVLNDGCIATDYPADVFGSIALIRRGVCPFGTKSELAGRAGAKAAVVWNPEEGNLAGTLGAPSAYHVATFGLSGEEARPVLEALARGEDVGADAYIDAIVESIKTVNVIAQTSQGDQDNCVMLGGHSDSVAEGPGINDDGSGSMALLEIATQLAKYDVNNCVRFAWWAGEEEGLLGSDWYVEQLDAEENGKIRLFMDYDMLASPNFAYQIYNATDALNPAGSEFLRDMYIDWYVANGLDYTFIPFDGRSDYVAFIMNGIPGGGVATGAEGEKTKKEEALFGGKAGEWYDKCYHQLCDDLGNLNGTAWVTNTRLIAHSVATFARSFDGFPERQSVKDAARPRPETMPYRGSKLVM